MPLCKYGLSLNIIKGLFSEICSLIGYWMQLDDYNPMQHIYLLTAQCGKELVKSFQQNFLAHNSMK